MAETTAPRIGRRTFTAGALLAAAALPSRVVAQASAPARLGIYSRHLQWTTAADAIAIAKSLGFTSIEWNVRAGGYVTPADAARELPRLVAATRAAGLSVDMVSANILDGDDAEAQAVMAACRAADVRLIRGAAGYRFEGAGGRVAQLGAIGRRIGTVAAAARRHRLAVAFHTYSNAGAVGGGIWDLLPVLQRFDPGEVGFNYDTGHVVARTGQGWRDALLAAGRHVLAVSTKDFLWSRGSRGWAPDWVPIGTGVVDLPGHMAALRGAGFAGPVILQVEHHGLLGGDAGKAGLSLPRADFDRWLRADREAVQTAMRAA